MTEYEFKLKADDAKKRFIRLAQKCEDLRPIWKKFIPEYKEIVSQNFESKGKIMEGERWKPYAQSKYRAMTKRELKVVERQTGFEAKSGRTAFSPYLVWKRKHYGNAPMGVLTGKMKEAILDFKSIPKKDNLIMKINGEDYYFYFQERKKYGRHTFYTKEKNMPTVAWRILIQLANDELKKDMA